MQDTFEVETRAVDWLVGPSGFTASRRVFVTHIILEIAKANKANGIFEVCVEKKAQGTPHNTVSACFTKRNIKRGSSANRRSMLPITQTHINAKHRTCNLRLLSEDVYLRDVSLALLLCLVFDHAYSN